MLCTRRVLPMPASPSMASADARPSLSWRTAAAATASSASRPTSPLAEDTLRASPHAQSFPQLQRQPKPACLSLCLIHPVRHRSPVVTRIVFAQFADGGGRWPALLESVLGATPQEFESPILRHGPSAERR